MTTGTPRPRRDCHHKQARHVHGTSLAYLLDTCRCPECTAAHAKTSDRRARLIAYGRYDTGRVDAGPIRAHIQTLREYGIGIDRIAQIAGVSPANARRIVHGHETYGIKPHSRVTRPVAEAILAVKPELRHLGQKTIIDATGTHRRLQALIAIGWSQTALAKHLGMLPPNLRRAFSTDNVHAETARKVQTLYEKLWNQPQTGRDHQTRIVANRARNIAKRNGWPPPLAWDDETIDDPDAAPNIFEETSLVHGEDRCNEIDFLIRAGCGQAEIIKRTGFNHISTLERFCLRYNRNDIVHRIKRLRGTEAA
jgi:hypothetical protein